MSRSEDWWSTRERWALSLKNRAERLVRLIQLEAPETIIERERRLVRDALQNLPIDERAVREIDAEEEREGKERKFLQ